MTIAAIKEKLHSYVENGDPKKVKALYTIIEHEIANEEIWSKEYVTGLNKRIYEMDNKLVKAYTMDEMIKEARKKTKARLKNGNKNASGGKH